MISRDELVANTPHVSSHNSHTTSFSIMMMENYIEHSVLTYAADEIPRIVGTLPVELTPAIARTSMEHIVACLGELRRDLVLFVSQCTERAYSNVDVSSVLDRYRRKSTRQRMTKLATRYVDKQVAHYRARALESDVTQ